MSDLVDGTIDGWPVSIEILRHYIGAPAYGAHCAPYTRENTETGEDDSAPEEVWTKCYAITDACDGLKPAAALRKAKRMGFVPDPEEE